MKPLTYAAVVLACVGLSLIGCADKSLSPVAPTDQAAREPASLEKRITTDFTVSLHYPTGLTGEGGARLVGRRWIIRRFGVIENVQTSEDRVTGTMVHYLSAILNANTGEGPVHGSFTLTPVANVGGGVWEGTYTGYRSKKPGSDTLFTLPLHIVGHGRGGTIRGMQLIINDVITAWGTPPVGWYGSGEGYMKSHGHH